MQNRCETYRRVQTADRQKGGRVTHILELPASRETVPRKHPNERKDKKK